MKELGEKTGSIKKELSERERTIGEMLLQEGLNYESIRERANRVGKHSSYFIHNSNKIISIHFREGMDELKKLSDRPVTLTKTFLINLKNDLKNLAFRLREQKSLQDIREVWGLCALSPKWGGRYGFRTKLFEPNPELVEKHESSISGKPEMGQFEIDQALYLFIHKRESFIETFGE